AGADEHEGIGGVDQGGLDAGHDVTGVPGGKQAPGARPAGVEEVQRDSCSATGHPGQLEIAVDGGLAVLHGDVGDDDLLGVRVVDADHRFALAGGDEPLVDGERTDGRRAVATVAGVVDDG